MNNNNDRAESGDGIIAERLQKLMGYRQVRARAMELGFTEGTLRNLLKGGIPKLDTAIRIADLFGVTLDWLAGRSPLGPSQPPSPPKKPSGTDSVTVQVLEQNFGDQPVASPMAFSRNWLREQGIDPAHVRAFQVRGDSMAQTIQAGAWLLVDTSQVDIGTEGVYVLRNNDVLGVKRLQFDFAGSVIVRSDNPAYRDIEVTTADLLVAGRVCWTGSKL